MSNRPSHARRSRCVRIVTEGGYKTESGSPGKGAKLVVYREQARAPQYQRQGRTCRGGPQKS